MNLQNNNPNIEINARRTFRNRLLTAILSYSNIVIPTIEINPSPAKILNSFATGGTTSSATTVTIMTTPATGGDFFLYGASLCYIKDAICDAADGNISITFVSDGITQNLIRIPIITLTAQASDDIVQFGHAIKIDRNTNIQITATTFTAGKLQKHGSIFGMFVKD